MTLVGIPGKKEALARVEDFVAFCDAILAVVFGVDEGWDGVASSS